MQTYPAAHPDGGVVVVVVDVIVGRVVVVVDVVVVTGQSVPAGPTANSTPTIVPSSNAATFKTFTLIPSSLKS
ncbi:MAG: hypothetical protein ACTSV6_06255 [Candidatus Heimdallarchaeota archaeon]